MEKFIEEPNLPKGRISLALIDGRVPFDMEKKLKEKGIRLIKTFKNNDVLEAVSYHPDIMVHHLGKNDIILAPNINKGVIEALEEEGFNIIFGREPVKGPYPGDVPYNAARVSNYVICNIKTTDIRLLNELYLRNLNIINVKQGYSKCSTAVVSKDAIITSDQGIYNAVKNQLDVLLIEPGYIDLFEMDYGFIGGASGCMSESEICFFGNIKTHPQHQKIEKFFVKI
ncbi:DUF6873 family GME fold protein [Fervidicella metallireducens]|uniref:DUF6873 family GME fold protein n=1 Tax=Fervidicella metallireducens TaxID=655338 RepID=UPI0006876939|nr:hypothetical protein [Fervidicella metallireducens]